MAKIRAIVLPIARSYHVRNIRVFGPFALGEQRDTNHIDLLVDLPTDLNLMALSDLSIDLNKALGGKVHVSRQTASREPFANRFFAKLAYYDSMTK